MNPLIIFFLILLLLAFVMISQAYRLGAVKVFKYITAMVVSFLISGIAVRIGDFFAPKLHRLTLLFAGGAALFFYAVFNIIFNSEQPGRYNHISLSSRRLACLLSLIELWLVLSFLCFFALFFFSSVPFPPLVKKAGTVLCLPLEFFWFFPK